MDWNPESIGLSIMIGAIALVVVAEVYLRLRYEAQLRLRIYPRVYVPDEDLGYRYRANAEGEIRIPGIHRRFRTNHRGFPSDDLSETKSPGTLRIAVIGPSNTTGIWMDGDGRNFCQILQERLRASGHQAEVLNFGIDGRFRSVVELRVIDTDVIDYRPDLVLIDVELPFVHGEFRRDVYRQYVMIYNGEHGYSRRWCEQVIDEIERRRALIAVYKASYVVRALTRVYLNRHPGTSLKLQVFVENRIQAPDIALTPYSIKKSVELLQAMHARLAERAAKMVLFQYSANPYFRQVTSKYELPYLELDVPPTPDYVHDHDGHYRHAGHVEIARQLEERLTAMDLLGKP